MQTQPPSTEKKIAKAAAVPRSLQGGAKGRSTRTCRFGLCTPFVGGFRSRRSYQPHQSISFHLADVRLPTNKPTGQRKPAAHQQPGPNRANDFFVARSTGGVAENSPTAPRPLTIRTRPPDRSRHGRARTRQQQQRRCRRPAPADAGALPGAAGAFRPPVDDPTNIHTPTPTPPPIPLVHGRRPALITTTPTHRRPASRRGRRRGPSPTRTRTPRSRPGSSGASSAPRTTVRVLPCRMLCGMGWGGGRRLVISRFGIAHRGPDHFALQR